jgi:hypothetical protein
MKKITKTSTLALGLVAALLMLCPLDSRATDYAADSRFLPIAQIRDAGCPLKHTAQSAECAGNGEEQSFSSDLVMREADSAVQVSFARHEPGRSALEDLMRNGSDRDAESP